MALITLQDAQLAYGHWPLLDHADFSLEARERDRGAGAEVVPLFASARQVSGQRVEQRCRDRTGRNGKARPRKQRGGEHDRVPVLRSLAGQAAFDAGFDRIGQFVIGGRIVLPQMVERTAERLFVAVGQQAGHQLGQSRLPITVFDTAGRQRQPVGETGELGGVLAKAATA